MIYLTWKYLKLAYFTLSYLSLHYLNYRRLPLLYLNLPIIFPLFDLTSFYRGKLRPGRVRKERSNHVLPFINKKYLTFSYFTFLYISLAYLTLISSGMTWFN